MPHQGVFHRPLTTPRQRWSRLDQAQLLSRSLKSSAWMPEKLRSLESLSLSCDQVIEP